ncbi:MAG TPA: hypothetical protein VFM62_03165 [Arthrobacter sp.]|nr:hypothetical protein [Arthrobacter sp.]
MTRKLMTILGLALGPVALLLVDVIFTQTSPGGVFNGIFELVRATGVVAWPVGVLIGHWYGPPGIGPVVRGALNYVILIGGSLLAMGLSLFFLNVAGASHIVSTIALLAGMVVGALFWTIDEPSAVRADRGRSANIR